MTWIALPDGYKPPGFRASLAEPKRWWELRNQADADDAELLIFDEVGGWFGVYADEFVEQLNRVTARNLTVRLNSPGGSVFQGIAIGNALRAHPASVTVRVEGLAASIASIIALAGDRLVMAPNSMIMIHDAADLCCGPASEMEKAAEILNKVSDNLADAYAAKAGGTRAEWRTRMLEETWYNAAEAVEAGLADELMVPPEPAEPADATTRMAARWDLSVFRYEGRANAPAPPPQNTAPTGDAGDPPPAPSGQAPAPPLPEAVPQPQAVTPSPATAPPDPWADLIAHLLQPPAPPSADDLLTHLREAQ